MKRPLTAHRYVLSSPELTVFCRTLTMSLEVVRAVISAEQLMSHRRKHTQKQTSANLQSTASVQPGKQLAIACSISDD